MTTDYLDFSRRMLGHELHGPRLAQVTCDVVATVSDGGALNNLCGGDFHNANHAIDTQLDKIIVACDGDMRLAMFNLAVTAGRALTELLGPRP